MSDESKKEAPKVQAANSSIAIGNISAGGNIGDIYIGNTGYTVKEVSDLITQITSTFQPKPFDGRCPYKGLDVFDEEDAELFFGREKLVVDLVHRVKDSRTVFVTGPSGSGKSSLVRAGLIHALKQGAVNDLHSERWLYATMKPGRDPLDELARVTAGLASSTNAEDEVRAKALTDATIFARWCEIAMKDGPKKRVVLFIDQFEEVFTQISEEEERVAFLNLLTYAATVGGGRVILLFAMRSDFVSNCATYPKLNTLLNQQFVQIGAMQPEELVSAIAQPAQRVGLRVDPDLIAQIINDMKGEPGALPLMQFALRNLFDVEQAKNGIIALTLSDYLEHGGIDKALERHANASLEKLTDPEKELARNVFSGLIEIGRGTQDTRRTALSNELLPAGVKADAVKSVVQKLASARLITTDAKTVTISHEKLIDAWPWLKKLVNENRDVIALQNEIAKDAVEWDEHKRDASYLYRGARLANACEKLASKMLVLSELAQRYIKAGVEIEEAERLKEESRRQKELNDAHMLAKAEAQRAEEQTRSATKLRQQTRYLTMALVAALLAAVIAVYFGFQSQQQTKLARAGELAAVTVNLRENQPVLSLLIGIENFRLNENLRTRSVLLDNLNHNPQVLQYFSGQSKNLEGVAFSPDGNILASAGYDKVITLWDMQTRQRIGIIQTSNIIWSIAFSPDGKMLATGNNDNSITVWNTTTLKPVGQPFIGHSDIVRCVAFSPDGKTIASGSADSKIILWDVQSQRAIGQPFIGHFDIIYSISFSPDGKTIASGSEDHTVILWDTQTHKPIDQPLVGHTDWVKSVVFSPDGRILASGGVDKTIILWDVKTHKEIGQPITGHSGEVRTLAFSPDGKILASGSADKTIILWDVQTRHPISPPFTGHTERVVNISFNPDGRTFASCGDDGLTILWNIQNHLPIGQVVEKHKNSVTSLAFSPNGKIYASASNDQSVILFDSVTNRPMGDPMTAVSERVTSIVFNPDGKALAAGYADGKIVIWDVSSRQPICESLIQHLDGITSLTFRSDGKMLASGSLDNKIIIWDLDTCQSDGQPLTGHLNAVWSIAFSHDGNTLASGGGDQKIILWDMKTRKSLNKLFAGHSNRVNSVAFSPDDKLLASGGFDNTIRLWKVITGTEVSRASHDSFVYSVAFSPNGKMLASGSADKTIRLWDLPNLQPIGQPLKGNANSVTSIVFNPNNKGLVSGEVDGSIILWDIDSASWIQKTCQLAGRNFELNEWAQYFSGQSYHVTCPQWPSGT